MTEIFGVVGQHRTDSMELIECCSLRPKCSQRMLMKFQANGYSCQQINRYTKNSRKCQQQRRDHSCIFKVPFISDQFNGQLKRLLKKSSLDIRLVTQPAPSISRQLNKNKRYQNCNLRSCPIQNPAICNATNVAFRATCSVCGQFYIYWQYLTSLPQTRCSTLPTQQKNRCPQSRLIPSTVSKSYL